MSVCDCGFQRLAATSAEDQQAGYWRLTEAPEKPHGLESLGRSTRVDTEMLSLWSCRALGGRHWNLGCTRWQGSVLFIATQHSCWVLYVGRFFKEEVFAPLKEVPGVPGLSTQGALIFSSKLWNQYFILFNSDQHSCVDLLKGKLLLSLHYTWNWKRFLPFYRLYFFILGKYKVAFIPSSPSFLVMWPHVALLSLQDNMGRKTWEGEWWIAPMGAGSGVNPQPKHCSIIWSGWKWEGPAQILFSSGQDHFGLSLIKEALSRVKRSMGHKLRV